MGLVTEIGRIQRYAMIIVNKSNSSGVLLILGTYSWVAVAVAVLLLLVICMWKLEFYQAVTAGVGVFTLAVVIGKYRIQHKSMPDGKTDETEHRKPKIQHHCPEKGQESTDPAGI